MRGRLHLSPPDIRGPEREKLLEAVESGWAAPVGPALNAFEGALADRCGVPYAVGLSSGTAALHLALLMSGVGSGDEVLVPTLTFVSTANAVAYCGATPCFIDSTPETWNMSPDLLAEELACRQKMNRLPSAVVTVDLYGQCAAYDEILPLCKELGVPVIEDAAEALGSEWLGKPAGSFGELSALSFNGNKIVTTSGGGALLCLDEQYATRARYLASQARQPFLHYEHVEVGFNYRLSNLLAAFGHGQLMTLDDRVARRRQIRGLYSEGIGDLPGVQMAPEDSRGRSNAWLSCILLDPGTAKASPSEVVRHLDRADVEARPLWKPMHAQPAFAGCPNRLDGTADGLFASGLCLPSGSAMDDDDVARVIDILQSCLG